VTKQFSLVAVVCGLWFGAQSHASDPPKKGPSNPPQGTVLKGLSPVQAKTVANQHRLATSRPAPASRPVVRAKVPRQLPVIVRLPSLSAGTRYFLRPVPRVILLGKHKKHEHAYNIALLAERLHKAPKSLIDKTIPIEGLVVRGDANTLNCTLMLCPKGFSCCNRCSQPLVLRDAWGKQGFAFAGLYKGRYVGCSGTECSQFCAPLQPNKRYRLQVTIKKLNVWSASKLSVYEMYHLHLVSFRPL
jgi:hypothetical protein